MSAPRSITVSLSLLIGCVFAARCDGAERILDAKMHHLRCGELREWSDFPQTAEAHDLVIHFTAPTNAAEQTLRLRHRDVKLLWRVQLNGKALGSLPQDENEMTSCLAVPAGVLKGEGNVLRIGGPTDRGATNGAESDDVLIGEVALIDRPTPVVLAESQLAVRVTDADDGSPIPCRVTIADERGGLVPLGMHSDQHLAVRTGVVYTADGQATVSLPAGRYIVYAGRGFEYSIDSATIDARAGESAAVPLKIRRVVPTPGYVACDTHIHTLTYSHHGDATLEERMLTLAGEGIELPIATDHNLQIDYRKAAGATGVEKFFTPVIGNEVTTVALGHFNVFPISAESKLINWRVHDWNVLGRNIAEVVGPMGADGPVVVLNHARDIHGGFRPFDPVRHIAVTGEDLDGQTAPANAMEVINSGAVLSDPLRLYRDWFGMLNRGVRLTPIGASDSHDVSRYIVGQGRTYIRCNDRDLSQIDVNEARRSLLAGRVLVSYGLLTDLHVNGRWESGDLVTLGKPTGADDEISVQIRVLGPEWTRATHLTLFANGLPVREADIATPAGMPEPAGLKWQETWRVPRPRHDVFLVAIATGPGIGKPYWPTAKPYQPTSPDFASYVLGSSGAVFIDADSSGAFDAAHAYAERLIASSAGADAAGVLEKLRGYDEAVAAQAAALLRSRLGDAFAPLVAALVDHADPAVRRGFEMEIAERKESFAARKKRAATTQPAALR